MMRTIIGTVLAFLTVVPGIAHAQTEQVFYYHTDAIGSVRMITDSTGQVVARYDYRPFGDPCGSLCGTISAPDPRQFAGKERDQETGLDYFGARYYAGGTGRFTTVDPGHVGGTVLDPQSWNAYAYARNNPLRMIDPDGTDYLVNVVGGDPFWSTDDEFERLKRNPGAGIRLLGNVVIASGRIVGTYDYFSPFDRVLIDAGQLADAGVKAAAKEIAINAATTGLFAGIRPLEWAAPLVSDSKLANIVDDIYKGIRGPSVPVGRGTTADAIRSELVTGIPTFGSFHSTKGTELATRLTNWLRNNPAASRSDRMLAEGLLRDLKNALAGR
jgi:RHS repeat-associated protein